MPKVTIIIVNFNGLFHTLRCLESIKKTIFNDYKILIVDNGSSEKEKKALNSITSSKIKIINSRTNLGFSGGNNLALKYCNSKYIALLNNDTIVTGTWLGELVNFLDNNEAVAVVQPKIRWLSDPKKFDYAGASGGFIDKYFYPFTRGRIFNFQEEDFGQYDQKMSIDWASGAACLIRSSAIDQVDGLFDERFFNYMEEIDFCLRVKNTGLNIYSVPSSIVFHEGAATSKLNSPLKRYWEHRNNLLLMEKHLPFSKNLDKWIPRIMFELTTYLYYFISLQWKFITPLFKAHLYAISKRNEYFLKSSDLTNLTIKFNKSIALEYYFLGRKTYGSLFKAINSGERTSQEVSFLMPTYYQHQCVYKWIKPFCKNKEVLEIGFGSGNGTKVISTVAKNVYAIDKYLDYQNINNLQGKRKNITFIKKDIETDYLNKKFDVIVCLQTIEHIKNQPSFLKKIIMNLRSKGTLIISTPNALTQGYNENPFHEHEFRDLELADLMASNNLNVNVYGLFGNKLVQEYELERYKKIRKIFSYDVLKLRNYIPVSIKKAIFSYGIKIVKGNLANKGSKISINSFKVSTNTVNSIDLIAVCTKA